VSVGWAVLAHRVGGRLICRMPAQTVSPERQRRWPPIVVALALQLLAGAFVAGAAYVLAPRGIVLRPMVAALLTGMVAASLTWLARLDVWWSWIQLCFAPALLLASFASLPRWIWIALFLALAAVYWSTFRTQVPLYLSSTKVRDALVPMLPAGAFTFMDLGSGVGGVLTDLSRHRADGEFHGIEAAPVPWLVSWLRIRLGRHTNCHAHWGSLWDADLSTYDVVFAYLSPVPMRALWEKVQREMRPGSRFISNTFVVEAHPPEMTIPVDDLHRSVLYVWTHSRN
jgi:hypothetical protein